MQLPTVEPQATPLLPSHCVVWQGRHSTPQKQLTALPLQQAPQQLPVGAVATPVRSLCPPKLRPPPIAAVKCLHPPVPLLQAVRQLPYLPSPAPAPQRPALNLAPPAQQQPQLRVPPVSEEPTVVVDVDPWVEAAKTFQMNSDFDWSHAAGTEQLDFRNLQNVMKEESAGKRTIQALGDKLMLHRLLKNLGVPQMPALLVVEGAVERPVIERFVHNHLMASDASEVIVKPTHLSNATGVIVLSQPKQEEVNQAIDYIQAHMVKFLSQKAGLHESVALQSLRPCFIGQPKYQSVVGFKTPLELRVIALWGKARLGVWWWGRGAAPGEFPQRNAWFVRRPAYEKELSEEDTWEVMHDHQGENLGFEKALELIDRHIRRAASIAESVATAFGAPFLRSDFFIGSPEWGVRLNEVAYGCGMEYRNRVDDEPCEKMIDDAPAIAQILQEGMAECSRRLPPQHFLGKLGAAGESYAEMAVAPCSPPRKSQRSFLSSRLRAASDWDEEDASSPSDCAVPEELCKTVYRRRAASADEERREAAVNSRRATSPAAAAMAAMAAAVAPWPAAPEKKSFSLEAPPLSGLLAKAGLRKPYPYLSL